MKKNNPERTTKSAKICSIVSIALTIIFILLSGIDILKPSLENQYPFFNKLWGAVLGLSLLFIILTIYFTLKMPKYKTKQNNEQMSTPVKNNNLSSPDGKSKIEKTSVEDTASNITDFSGTFDSRMVFHYEEDTNGDLSYILKPKVKVIDE